MVPNFESARDHLLELLGNKEDWKKSLLALRLVIIDNNNNELENHFYFSTKYENHTYLINQERDADGIFGSSSDGPAINLINDNILEHLRIIFMHELLKRSSIKDLVSYFCRFFNKLYYEVDYENCDAYFRLKLFNMDFKSGLFGISAYRINLIFPYKDELNADEIKDTTYNNKKIIITNRHVGESHNYNGFDTVLDINYFIFHFSLFAFTQGIDFYKDVLRLDYDTIFNIVDFLKTDSDTEIYNLKKEIINHPYSIGPSFEDLMEKFLKLCFRNEYKSLNLQSQHPNKKRSRIRDFIIDNTDSKNQFLKKLENRGVDFILFDAKNYKNCLGTRDVQPFLDYIRKNPSFGNFGIILSRRGGNENLNDELLDYLRDGMKLLILTQDDLIDMLDLHERGRSPVEIIENRYKNLLLSV